MLHTMIAVFWFFIPKMIFGLDCGNSGMIKAVNFAVLF